jgi:hypothetical protein
MSRTPAIPRQLPVLDSSAPAARCNDARSEYNLTSNENLPDEEGTETSLSAMGAVPPGTNENLPDEEGTETEITETSYQYVQAQREPPRRRGD